ncbi:MAG: 16S rRNA (adenine(1518)-N(6)/adenine(1519)-N(6))-dimethyltransferase RsmA [Actinomycetota bacterium]
MVGGKLLTPADVRELARRYSVTPSKTLGQNFVVDPNTIRRIVRLAGMLPDDRVIEVGAGFGSLTLALAEAAAQVTAIELDRKVLPALQQALSGVDNVTVLAADAMDLDFAELTAGVPHRLVANLPYNVATPLIANLLQRAPDVADFVIMVQREAGERLVAGPGSRTYGAVSLLVAYHCHSRILGRVPSTVFWPVPHVESLLVKLTRRPPTVAVGDEELMRVVRAAFGQRRKTVRNALASVLEVPVAGVERALERAGLPAGARAESLDLEEFARLTEALR